MQQRIDANTDQQHNDDNNGSRARSCTVFDSTSLWRGRASAIVCFFFFALNVAPVVARGLVGWCSWRLPSWRSALRDSALYGRATRLHIHSFISTAPVVATHEVRDEVTWFPAMPAVEGQDPTKIFRFVYATRDLKDFRFADRTGKASFTAYCCHSGRGSSLMKVKPATSRSSLWVAAAVPGSRSYLPGLLC